MCLLSKELVFSEKLPIFFSLVNNGTSNDVSLEDSEIQIIPFDSFLLLFLTLLTFFSLAIFFILTLLCLCQFLQGIDGFNELTVEWK